MSGKLLHDVSIEELYGMRARGMSNREIAGALGVSISTVYRHVGAMGEAPKQDAPAVKHKLTQTEKFMSRLEKKADVSHVATEPPRDPPHGGHNDSLPHEEEKTTHAIQQPPTRNDNLNDKTTFKAEIQSGVPIPVRVVKEYIVLNNIKIIWDNGRITITGADDLDGASVRHLCKMIMLISSALEKETIE